MDLLLYRDYIKRRIGEPIAIKTVFGWIFVGSDINVICNFENFKNTKGYCNFMTNLDDLHKNICKFWEIESYGTLPKSAFLPPYDQRALEILENTTKIKNGHFEVGLLWKDELPLLLNNRDLAVARFKSLEKKFRKNPDFHELYKTQIKEYLELRHAKQLTREESRNASVVTNYIPHYGVMNIHKPGRVRVVFDASAKYQGTSLNENLLPGIDFLNNLVSVITKFRTGKYAIIGDIDKMFHQVRVCENDIDALRFVWMEKPEDELLDYAMLVHLFGKVDSPCIANWSIKKAADNASPDAKFAINNNFYMDDFLKSMPNENELVKFLREVISVLNSCGFRLNKFISNSAFILESLPKTEIWSFEFFDIRENARTNFEYWKRYFHR